MRSILRGLALVVGGFVLCLFFLFTTHCQYVHVVQSAQGAEVHQAVDQRSLDVSIQPFWPSPVIDLFHPSKSQEEK